MFRSTIVFLVAALFSTVVFTSTTTSAVAQPVLGGQLFSSGGMIEIEVRPATAALRSELYLFEPGPEQFLATNRDVGTVVEIGPFPAGVELVFGIRVGGNEFRLGPADRNPDGIVHGQVNFTGPGEAIVGFEDLLNGGDRDYDDNVFLFTGGIAPTPPDVDVNAGPDQTVVEGTVVTLDGSDPAGDTFFEPVLVPSITRRTIDTDADVSLEARLDANTDGVVTGGANLTAFEVETELNVVNVIDVSGSTTQAQFGGDAGCGEDENNDGLTGTILDCEILAVLELNTRFADDPRVRTALSIFARRAATADVGPEDGRQVFTRPLTDADASGVADFEEATRSVEEERVRQFTNTTVTGGTNFERAAAEACEIAAAGTAERTIVAFVSDGFSEAGDLSDELPCGDTTFFAFAVGPNSDCAGETAGRPTLNEMAALTGGTCTAVIDPTDLPELLAATISPEVIGATLSIDGGAPIDVSDSLGETLPATGALSLSYDLEDALDGAQELCFTVVVRDSRGETPLSTCSAVRQSDGLYQYRWELVDRTGPPVALIGDTTPTPSFVAFDDGVYTFRFTATDSTGRSFSDETTVTVENADPTGTVTSTDSSLGRVTLVAGEFTDPGWIDTHTVSIDWGDGTISDGVVGTQGSGQGTWFGTHIYEPPGEYNVTVTVVDDDGGEGEFAATTPIGETVALWANADAAGALNGLQFDAASTSINGLAHSNAGLTVTSCDTVVSGSVEHVDGFVVDPACGALNPNLDAPEAVAVASPPLDLDFDDYRPGGAFATSVERYWDVSDQCFDGRWRVHDQDLVPGAYFVDCDVAFENASGNVTIITTGAITTSGSDLNFDAFADSLLFLSAAADGPAVTVASEISSYVGAVYARSGAVDLGGNANDYECGIYGASITVSGPETTVVGAGCGTRPAGVTAPSLQPALDVDVTTAAGTLTPGDIATFDVAVTNTGATLVLPGVAGVTNTSLSDGDTLTVDGLDVVIEVRSPGSLSWSPITLDAAQVGLATFASPSDGVTYGAFEAVGTTVDPGATAVWGWQLVADLTPDEVTALLDPTVTEGIRLRVDLPTTGGQGRSLFTVGADIAADIQALSGSVTNVDVSFLASNGTTQSIPIVTVEPGATIVETASLPIAVPAPILPGEPSPFYISRLRAIDGSTATGAAFAVGQGSGGRVVALGDTAEATIQLPVVTTDKVGPAAAVAGDAVQWDIRVANIGAVEATDVVIKVDFSDQALPVSNPPATLGSGTVETLVVETTLPADAPRAFSEKRTETTWQDANGNTYGPTYGIAPLNVLTGADLNASLTDALAVDADLDGLVSPGDTIGYTATLNNIGDVELTGIELNVPVDANLTIEDGSVVGGTVTADGSAGLLTITLDPIAALAEQVVEWQAVIVDPFPEGTATVQAQGTISSTQLADIVTSDPGAAVQGAPTLTPVTVPFPLLSATLAAELVEDADLSGGVTAGDTLRYTTEITNEGNAVAADVVATIPLQGLLTFVDGSETVTGGTVAADDVALTYSAGDIPGGALGRVEFDVVLADPLPIAQSEISVQATVSAPGLADVVSSDPTTAENLDPTVLEIGSSGSTGGGTTGGGTTGGGGLPVSSGNPAEVPGEVGNVGNVDGPVASDFSLPEGAVVTEATPITAVLTPSDGSTIDTWQTILYPAGGDPADGVEIGSGTGTPTELGVVDPTVLENGVYKILVVATDDQGRTRYSTTSVAADGFLKPGRFTTSFLDAQVQVGGVAMQVQRTYDTLDRNQSADFGFGWSLDVGNFTVDTNRGLGLGQWSSEACGAAFFFFSDICWTSSPTNFVTVTWPDGRTESFDFSAKGNTFFSILASPEFTPRDGATSTLQAADGGSLGLSTLDGHFHEGLFGSGDIYDPQRFVLEATDGSTYLLDRNTGLVEATDPAGNTVTYTDAGFISSQGPSLLFDRDADGRIIRVTEPTGDIVSYFYNDDGDLASVTNQRNITTTMAYDPGHYLIAVDDPTGAPSTRMSYGPDGRLESITDSNGNVTAVSFVDDRTQVITSPDSQLTTLSTRDERGNLVRYEEVYDGTTNVTTYTYNANDLVTSRTDPLGNTWQGTYDEMDNLLSFTDAEGHETTIVYDANNYPTSVTNPEGEVTLFDYDERGLLLSTTDARGAVTAFTYDDQGNELTVTDPLGRTTVNTWTADGLLLTTTDPRGNETTFTYDSNGRMATRTEPDGGVWSFESDAVGNLRMTTDPLGRTTVNVYDERNRLVSTTDPGGFSRTFAYDGNDRLITLTDETDRVWRYEYAFDRLVRRIAPDGGVTVHTYDGAGRMASTRDPVGETTTFTYDAAHRRTGVTYPYGDGLTATEATTYDPNGRIVAVTNGEGETVTRVFDEVGRMVEQLDGLNRPTLMVYDEVGNLLSRTNAAGEQTQWEYDIAGQLLAVIDPLGGRTSYGYDAVGNNISVTDPIGRETNFVHDEMNRLVSTVMPGGQASSTVFDLAGQRTSYTSPAGVAMSYSYEPRGLIESITDELANTWTSTYDGARRLLTTTNARGNATEYLHGPAGRLVQETDPLGGQVTFGYSEAGQRTQITDPRGEIRQVSYDDAGLVASEIDALGRDSTMTYDAAGRLVTYTDARGVVTTMTYDAAGQLTERVSPNETQTFAYDPIGRLISMTDATGSSTMTYDDLGRMTGFQNSAGDVSYTYNAASERLAMTQPEGTLDYEFDANGLPSALTDWRGERVEIVYDADGRIQSAERPNDISSVHDYDAAGRLTAVTHSGPAGLIESFTYTLDPNGNNVGVVSSSSGSETYVLDALNRITSVSYGNGDTESFTYDPAGNRIGHTDRAGVAITSTFDAAGQLTADSDGTTYTYDASGNLVANSSGDTYTWDDHNRMAAADVGGVSQTYAYDAMDVRVAVDGAAQLWDRADGLPSLIQDGSVAHVHGPAGVLRSGDDWQLTDGIGSVRVGVSLTGDTTGDFDYSVFGEPLGAVGVFGFTGQQHDATGLQHLRARQYDAQVGRLLGVDPIQPSAPGTSGWNQYAYAGNNPTTWADPSGEISAITYGIILGATVAAIIGLFTCDNGDSWWIPAENLDFKCWFVEIALGAIFGAFGGAGFGSAAGSLGRRLLAACAWGAFEGGTSAAVSDGFADDRDINAGSIGFGALFGCLVAGLFTGGAHWWSNRGPNIDAPTRPDGTRPRPSDEPNTPRGPYDCSFAADTPVLMADGSYLPISEVELGDRVLAGDPGSGAQHAAAVEHLFVHPDSLVELGVGDSTVWTTANHPFWNDTDQRFERVQDLDPGDRLLTADGRLVPVVGIRGPSQAGLAYNLAIQGIHTYYVLVGDDPVLVHNTCGTRLDPRAYGDDDLSAAVLAERLRRGDRTGNWAAAEVNGEVITARSDGLFHAEENILRQVEDMGFTNADIDRLYTEYSPCSGPHACSIIAGNSGEVTYHIPYGQSGYREARDAMVDRAFRNAANGG